MLLIWLVVGFGMAAVPPETADRVAMGDCARVVQSLPSPDEDDERLVAGFCLHKLGRHTESIAALAAIKAPGVYSDYGRYVRARALVDIGKPTEAIATLVGVALPGSTGLELRLLRDRLLVETDRSLEARDDLRALLDTEVRDEARYYLAMGGERRADEAAAIATYRRTWAESVIGPWSKLAATRLAALGAPVPDLDSAEGRALVRERIAALRKGNQNQAALALLDQLHVIEPPTTTAARLEHARVRFDARDYAGARDAYKAALGDAAACTGEPADLFEYALTTARAGDYATAAVIYRRLGALHPTTKDADFGSFKLGYMEYDRGNLEAARREFAAHLARRPESAHLDEALWFSARAAWRLGDHTAAVEDLDALLTRRPSSSLAPGAAYWKARARGIAGDATAERALLEELVTRWPTSGHAWFAAERLGRTFPTRARAPRPAWPSDWAARREVQRGEALLALGLLRWARAELAPIAAAVGSAGRDTALAAAHAFIAAGDYNAGKRLADPYCVAPWKGGDPVAQQACTPMPEGTIVFATAREFGLDPLVPFGVMTAESALKPEVTSIAGARGLMQLMPEEAPRIHAAVLGDAPFDPDDLYSAPYNAALGTAELGMKSQSLEGVLQGTSLPAVIASYNGGEEAVRRWVAGWDHKPEFDEFAEDVGYTETRQYVRRVLGYVMAYRWVYGDP